MPLEAKGSIKYEFGAKEPYILKSQALSLELTYKQEPMSIDSLLQTLQSEIQRDIQTEFARPVNIRLIGFSLNAVYEVEGIPNRTLDEFSTAKAPKIAKAGGAGE